MKTAGAVAAATFLLLTGCGSGNVENEANAQAPPPTVIVEAVRQTTVPIVDDYEGTLNSIESVALRARVEGTLDAANFKEGDLVHQGDLVFQIQPNEYAAALQAARAQVGAARAHVSQAAGNLYSREAALARANTTVERDRPLAADKAIPQKDLDNAVQNAEIAKGDVTAAQAQIAVANAAVMSGQAAVDTAQINLGYTTVYAPVTGLIGFLNYDVGNVVGGAGTQVLDTISAIDPIEVTFSLDEPTFLRLFHNRRNTNVSSLRDQDLKLVMANNEPYQYAGRLYTFNPTVDPKTGTIAVKARFPNPDGLLRPGGFVRVRLTIERRENALAIAQTAVTKSQGVDTVYVVNDKDEVELRSVTLGPQFEHSVVVLSGVKKGERVIVEGVLKVKPGAKVVVKAK
jgi:membrane fusion protein (multidrug efflux system)